MAHSVYFTASAERHFRAIDEWWQVNRTGAPGLFAWELTDAIRQLAGSPHSGKPYEVQRPVGARRLLLRRTGYHVYFTVDDEQRSVAIRAIWHAARGRPPRLR